MASDKRINQLPSAVLPLTGTELVPIQQGATTVQAPVSSIGGGTPGLAAQYRMGNGSLSYGIGPIVNIKDFGVVGDGTTDDTAAINAAFAHAMTIGYNFGVGATVVWGTGVCKVTDTIIVGDNTPGGAQVHISIDGFATGSEILSVLNYVGPTDRPLLRIIKNTNFSIKNLWVTNAAGSRGTTTGIMFGSNGTDGGNQVADFYCEKVRVENCHIGVSAGGFAGAASEGTFMQCSIGNNDTGFAAIDPNSLDFNFLMCSIGGNGIGIDSSAGGGVNVHGGSGTSNTIDFQSGNNDAVFNVIGWRSEVGTTFLNGATGAAKATVRNCLVQSPPSPFKSVTGLWSRLSIIDSYFDGGIFPDNLPDVLEMRGNFLGKWDTTRNLPLFIPIGGGQNMVTRAILKNNTDISQFPAAPIQDFDGTLGVRFDGNVTNTPFGESSIAIFPQDHRATVSTVNSLGVGLTALCHVKQLSEGSMPGVAQVIPGAPTPGQNLRVSGTFASSGTLTVNFVRTGLTVSASGSVITASVGTFLATDVGKLLTITAGADTGADWNGYITKFTSSTVVEAFPNPYLAPGCRNSNASAKAAQVGANEPDGAYLVAGLCGNANETFWVTGITSTGFTLHSSNTTSTANVTALIVR